MMQLITYNKIVPKDSLLAAASELFHSVAKTTASALEAKTNAICHRHVASMFIVINNTGEIRARRCAKKIIQKQNKQELRQDEAILSHEENTARELNADVMTKRCCWIIIILRWVTITQRLMNYSVAACRNLMSIQKQLADDE